MERTVSYLPRLITLVSDIAVLLLPALHHSMTDDHPPTLPREAVS